MYCSKSVKFIGSTQLLPFTILWNDRILITWKQAIRITSPDVVRGTSFAFALPILGRSLHMIFTPSKTMREVITVQSPELTISIHPSPRIFTVAVHWTRPVMGDWKVVKHFNAQARLHCWSTRSCIVSTNARYLLHSSTFDFFLRWMRPNSHGTKVFTTLILRSTSV